MSDVPEPTTGETGAKGPPFDVVAVDNLDVVRLGLLSLQILYPEQIRSIRVFGSIDAIRPELSGPPPAVVILDYRLGEKDEVSALPFVAPLQAWGAKVVLYTNEQRPAQLQKAIRAGVDGVSPKGEGLKELVRTVTTVAQGQPLISDLEARAAQLDRELLATLTPTERVVMEGVAYGLTQRQISERWPRERPPTNKTIDTHIENIRRKYVVRTGDSVPRARMILLAMMDGYFDPRDWPGDTAKA